MKLPKHTLQDVMAVQPCYNPVARGYVKHDWKGTALDVLRLRPCPYDERIWVVSHTEWMPDKTVRQYICWCLREMLKLVKVNSDFVNAVKACEDYTAGKIKRRKFAAAVNAAYNDSACVTKKKPSTILDFPQWQIMHRLYGWFTTCRVSLSLYGLYTLIVGVMSASLAITNEDTPFAQSRDKIVKKLNRKLIQMLSQ